MEESNIVQVVNPIDAQKIAENPGLLPYAHNVGGFVIKPTEQGQIKGKAMLAMEQQVNNQLAQIYEQIQTLAAQAKGIQDRVEISKMIYEAEMSFEPNISQLYYLYRRKNGTFVLSMVASHEWGRTIPFEEYVAEARLLADHTWEVRYNQ